MSDIALTSLLYSGSKSLVRFVASLGVLFGKFEEGLGLTRECRHQ